MLITIDITEDVKGETLEERANLAAMINGEKATLLSNGLAFSGTVVRITQNEARS